MKLRAQSWVFHPDVECSGTPSGASRSHWQCSQSGALPIRGVLSHPVCLAGLLLRKTHERHMLG